MSRDLLVHPAELFIAIVAKLIGILLLHHDLSASLVLHLSSILLMHRAATANLEARDLRFSIAVLLLLQLLGDHLINLTLTLISFIAV